MEWQPTQCLDVLKTQERYSDLAAYIAQGKRIAWVIRKLDEERLCGKIELRIDGTDGDIGYGLGVSHWGQGIAPEAVTAALKFARRQGLCRVTGTCDPESRASIRVFEKCGFRYVGRKKAALIRPTLSHEERDSRMLRTYTLEITRIRVAQALDLRRYTWSAALAVTKAALPRGLCATRFHIGIKARS